MKRYVVIALSIFATAAIVGWKLASYPETSVELQEITLIQNSEHSQPGPAKELAGLRIRLSPSDFGYDIAATAGAVPQIAAARIRLSPSDFGDDIVATAGAVPQIAMAAK
jgi:hypothetical protein